MDGASKGCARRSEQRGGSLASHSSTNQAGCWLVKGRRRGARARGAKTNVVTQKQAKEW